jgi:membrane-bound metal-dependent hydrolase YbcI (DUF457 family)
MFLFGHVGLTWGGALLFVELSHRLAPRGASPGSVSEDHAVDVRGSGVGVDYRVVILGSVLPDLIDKPLGVYILGDELGGGRVFAHSLAFLLLLVLSAVVLQGRVGRSLYLIAIGAAGHAILDRMWMNTDTLFWPLSGWRPERHDVGDWLEQTLERLFSDPYIYVSEIAGAVAVAALLGFLLFNGSFRHFVRSGRMALGLGGEAQRPLAAGEERPHELERGQGAAER